MKKTGVKRVLHVTGKMNRGGAETMLMNIYREIDKSKIQFDFLVYSDISGDFDEEIKKLGGKIYYIPSVKESGLLKYYNNIKQIINEHGPYIAIHSHTLFNSAIPLFCAKLLKIPRRIGHAHSTSSSEKFSYKNRIYSRIMRMLINYSATLKLACGNDAGKNLYGDSFTKDGLVLPNAINPDDFTLQDETTMMLLKNELGLLNGIIIGHVGSFRKAKNHDFMLKIAKVMKNKGLKFQMVFVGNGPLFEKVKREVNCLDLQDEIIFLGQRNDVNILMRAFDVILMPSLYEGFPVTLVESQYSRVKAIISDNITKDVDFKLGFIERLSLEDPIDLWIKAIKDGVKFKDSISEDKVFNQLNELGFLVENSVRTLTRVYLE